MTYIWQIFLLFPYRCVAVSHTQIYVRQATWTLIDCVPAGNISRLTN